MNWLLLLSLTISAQNVSAIYSGMELMEIREEIREVTRDRDQFVAQERKLRARLKGQTGEASQQLRLELDETRQIVEVLTEKFQMLKAEERKIEASPERRVSEVLRRDKRRPSKSNLSGVWTTGWNLTGRSVQLNQRGKTITGEGFNWGCLGISRVFEVIGSYHAPILTLTFVQSANVYDKRVYHYREEKGRPGFYTLKGDRLMPALEPSK